MKKNTTNNKTIRTDQKFSVSKATAAIVAIGSTKYKRTQMMEMLPVNRSA